MPGIDDSLHGAMTIPGVLGVGLVDCTSGLAVGSAGLWPHGDEPAAASATEVVRAALENADFAESAQGDVLEDIVVASRQRYHVLRLLNPRYSGSDARLFLYLWLDRDRANLAIARRSLAALAADLVLS